MTQVSKRHRALGFTMIEMVVTLTLFAAVLSSLVMALHTGIKTWRVVRANAFEAAELELAFETIYRDLRHAAVMNEETPPLLERTLDEGGEELVLTALAPRWNQRYGATSVWARVSYAVLDEDSDDKPALIRRYQPYGATGPIGEGPTESILLHGVDALTFDYLTGEGPVPVWEATDRLPVGLRIRIQATSGKTTERSITIPMGFLHRGASR